MNRDDRVRSSQRRQLRVAVSATSRLGLSLLEVVLALGIFLTALAAISQLIAFGTRASLEARLEAEGALRAETALSEVVAGIHPMQSVDSNSFEDDATWKWSLAVAEGPHVDLLRLEVTAFRQEGEEPPRGTVTLTRLIRNPDLFLDAALSAEGL